MSKFSQYSLLPIRIIRLATKGDPIAMQYVLTRYRSYILKLSSLNRYENDSEELIYVDEYMRRQLETKLIEKVLKFDVTR
ncbi:MULTISPECIES: helix-turn-helix domain-containing protein [unclassified Enterococcus]|uniref:helix-turn-helix domain-containing protein n=1 Tax=unclassified Enterococcus TaxID=2608891 RepID=UPI00155446E5|nr:MULTISPECIES: helix-turn-helix domain-containing protein [unclassified Enterococcus]MBS7576132.1 helix-turn-helix domain-containing protein [Enterococcus sp. MMGLQ5-2]MBS7583365.1 helix-turn-helix domain-containing protein [Enterococcus sp. MMGLQ5-1]NPD11225.1 helix-turn-helix domain-containing protein [Enterococcus sp. MMGLQ5-1]NPD35968.1 helix-turn-helix domain-containing protein [Enterococcus sp. MMGLQ5-2]